MLFLNHKIFIFLIFFFSWFRVDAQSTQDQLEESTNIRLSHFVKINHPGKSANEQPVLNLIEFRDNSGFPVFYSMKVGSVFCNLNVCRIDTVNLIWNNIGTFQRFEIGKGIWLEKEDAKHFENDDYAKLQALLSNTNSILKSKKVNFSNVRINDLDARTGATISSEDGMVKGAYWTCFTLWHYAQGDVVSIIKGITSKAYSDNKLLEFLSNENAAYRIFALEELKNRKIYNIENIHILSEKLILDDNTIQPLIDYLESAPFELYTKGIDELYYKTDNSLRLQFLQSLQKFDVNLKTPYLFRLLQLSDAENSYEQIDKLLFLINKQNDISNEIISYCFDLLNSNNILIKRVSYWFLKDKNLTRNQMKVLNKFVKKNKYIL